MGFYRLWVVTEMGYDRVDCIQKDDQGPALAPLHDNSKDETPLQLQSS
jgi:hypothetical protein